MVPSPVSRSETTPLPGASQSVSLTHLLAWRTGPHAHTRCTRLAREPTRGTLSPAVALGPDCWTHNTQLTGQLTRWRCIVGFSGTDTGEEGGAQGRGHRTHELISQPAPGAVARASAGVLWTRSLAGARPQIRRQSLQAASAIRAGSQKRSGAVLTASSQRTTEFTMMSEEKGCSCGTMR